MQSSLRAPSQVHLETGSNSVEIRGVSSLTMSRETSVECSPLGAMATTQRIVFFVSRNEAFLELGEHLRLHPRKFLEDEWRDKCVGRAFVASQIAILRCARAQCVAANVREVREVEDPISYEMCLQRLSRNILCAARIARRSSQPHNWRYLCFFFLTFAGEVSAFPSASRHYGIAAG